MKYGKKYEVKWTPQLVRQIVLVALAIFIVGGVVGYTIRAVSAKSTPTVEVVEPTLSVETTEVTTSERVEDIKVYYDCPLSHDLQDYIRTLCGNYGVPMSLIIAMIDVESSFRADVISKTNDYGLMQINIINHEWLREEYDITDFLDPYQNVFCGIAMIAEHYNRYCDVNRAVMAYNLGLAGAKRLWDKSIFRTSYTDKINAAMEVYENEV